MQAVLYGKIKESKETGREWLTGENTQNIPYFSTIVTQHKKRQGRVRRVGAY